MSDKKTYRLEPRKEQSSSSDSASDSDGEPTPEDSNNFLKVFAAAQRGDQVSLTSQATHSSESQGRVDNFVSIFFKSRGTKGSIQKKEPSNGK